jgi:hypothetical protein
MQKPYVYSSHAILVAMLLMACGSDAVGDDLLEPVHAGMPKDSLIAIIGNGPLAAQFADTSRLDHGYRSMKYLVDGKLYEVIYYREQPGNVAEAVDQFTEPPIVLSNGRVLGWGWKFYVEEGIAKLRLPTPLRESQRSGPPRDSIASD